MCVEEREEGSVGVSDSWAALDFMYEKGQKICEEGRKRVKRGGTGGQKMMRRGRKWEGMVCF